MYRSRHRVQGVFGQDVHTGRGEPAHRRRDRHRDRGTRCRPPRDDPTHRTGQVDCVCVTDSQRTRDVFDRIVLQSETIRDYAMMWEYQNKVKSGKEDEDWTR